MAVPAALIAIGAATNIYSQYTGNQAQARAEIENAKFYDLQAQYALEAMSREASLSRRKYTTAISAQQGALARGNVSISEGSSISTIANTLAQKVGELDAIRTKGELESSLAFARAAQARSVAKTLKSTEYNLGQVATTVLTAAAMGA